MKQRKYSYLLHTIEPLAIHFLEKKISKNRKSAHLTSANPNVVTLNIVEKKHKE